MRDFHGLQGWSVMGVTICAGASGYHKRRMGWNRASANQIGGFIRAPCQKLGAKSFRWEQACRVLSTYALACPQPAKADARA
jgi:hypothetical protein